LRELERRTGERRTAEYRTAESKKLKADNKVDHTNIEIDGEPANGKSREKMTIV
jgi:hypothetical protein